MGHLSIRVVIHRDGSISIVTGAFTSVVKLGLTVMAIDEAIESGEVLDCRPMWARYDAAMRG